MDPFKAFRIHSASGGNDARLETITLADLADGDVVIRGEYSSINYKDALAATGAGRILRRYPLVGGVDIAGTVVSSGDARVREGDRVVVCGCGLSESHDGGFAQYARVHGEWVTVLPDGLDTRTAMAIGTAGFTAGLAIHAMERNGQAPDQGPVAVTGATGGVGSLAIDMLGGRGYTVTALTSKRDAAAYLQSLGASDVLNLRDLEMGKRPLEKALWAGAIDNLGGEALAWLTRTTLPYGNIASIGLAAGAELHTTVMPFILRGVNLLGINSVAVPRALRIAIWSRLAGDLRPRHLDRIATREVGLDELPAQFQPYIDGTVTGRTLVRLA
jgi:NADPH2:quinone reductase